MREDLIKRVKTNKRRATEMERRVSERLKAKRVPMSGAGSIKGDVFSSSEYGMYVCECKFTSGRDRHDHAGVTVNKRWLKKLDEDQHDMTAQFSFLVLRFHRITRMFVLMRREYYERLFGPPTNTSLVQFKGVGCMMKLPQLEEWLRDDDHVEMDMVGLGYYVLIDFEKLEQKLNPPPELSTVVYDKIALDITVTPIQQAQAQEVQEEEDINPYGEQS
jgi:hypothetical protein